MNNQLLALILRERGLLDQPQGVGLLDYQNPQPQQNELMAQLLASWNPLVRKPVYQPGTATSGVRG